MTELSGTLTILAMDLRRDKIVLPVCVATFAAVAAGSAAATIGLFPDEASRVEGAELINLSPALVAMYGRVYDPTSIGALSMIKMIGMGTVAMALFAVMIMVRHTRADEELGRHELLSGGSLGRSAPLAAALLVAAGASVIIGLVTGLALVATGLPAVGSFTFGLCWTVSGFAFAGVGAVAAQLTASARAARGLAVAALGVAFLLRATGDATGGQEPGWATWVSPIGWAQQVRPFAGDRQAVALLPLAFAVIMIAVAVLLIRHRDLGAGLLPQRAGSARAGRLLSGPVGLAWRLQRASFLGWLIGFVVLSLVVGQVVPTIGDLLTSTRAREMITAIGGVSGMIDAFIAVELSFVAVFAAAYGISCTLRLAVEESTLRGEAVLTAPVGRIRWFCSHLGVALVCTAALMLASGVTVGLVHAALTDDGAAFGRDLVAAAVRIPPVWVMISVTAAFYGVARRAAPVAWGVLVATFLASEFGPLVDLPSWVRDLSPFTHVPDPGATLAVAPLLGLLAVAAVLTGTGLVAFRRRDLMS